VIVDCIRKIEQFVELKPRWDQIYASDAHATLFVGWPWLRGWMEASQEEWLVLAVRPSRGSSHVAFLPLAAPVPQHRLSTPGVPLADHTGMLCLPEYETEAVDALASYVKQKLTWNRLQLLQVSDPRLERFVQEATPPHADVHRTQTPCPYIALPESWDEYLMQSLKSNARRKLRRCLEQIDDDDQVYVTMAQADDLEERTETLLTLWQARWGEKPAAVLDGCRATFRRCFEQDSLYLATVWHTETPVVCVACLVDRAKSTFSGYICSWDPRFAEMSPGIMGWAWSIRDAIQSGMRGYDFLRGDERYKYVTFGAVDRFNTNFVITRAGLHKTAEKLLRRGIGVLRSRSSSHAP
jgi:CelD/BcsL family acetyltransferase involved in cellulose biosynthesis